MTEDNPKRTASPKTIAIILSYNCADLLPHAYDMIPKDLVDDILVTDNASTDGSYEVAQGLGVTVFRNPVNMGYGGNVKAGLREALKLGADYVVEVHGDAQFNPAALAQAVPLMLAKTDFIIGSRFIVPGRARELEMPLARFLANRSLSYLDRKILGLPFSEFHTGFRVYGRNLLDRVAWERNSDDYLFSFQIIAQAAYAGVTVGEVPVEADYRGKHTSVSIGRASIYSVQTLGVLAQFLMARAGLYRRGSFSAAPAAAMSKTAR